MLTTAVARQGAIRRVRRRVEAAAGRRLEAYEHGELPYENTDDLQLGGGGPVLEPVRRDVAHAGLFQPGQSSLPSAISAADRARALQALIGMPTVQDPGTCPLLVTLQC